MERAPRSALRSWPVWLAVLPLYLAGCVASAQPQPAGLQARPNPVPVIARYSVTSVHWSTGDGSTGQVFVSVDGGPEALFGQGASGAQSVTWIELNHTYEFRLYTGLSRGRLIATTAVTGEAASPLPYRALYYLLLKAQYPSDFLRYAALASGAGLLLAAWRLQRRGRPEHARVRVSAAAILSAGLLAASAAAVESSHLPVPDTIEYANAARQILNGNGYVTDVSVFGFLDHLKGHLLPPLHPPGYSLALLPFVALDDNPMVGARVGAKFYSAAYVVATVAAAWAVGGPLAGALASGIVGVSPFAFVSAAFVISDTPAAALTVALVVLLARLTRLRAALAGALSGALVTVRLPMLLNLASMLPAAPAALRARLVLYALPAIAGLGFYQWAVFGSPFKSGLDHYLAGLRMFDWSYAVRLSSIYSGSTLTGDYLQLQALEWACRCQGNWPQSHVVNVVFYPMVLLGLMWTYSPPLATLPGLAYVWRHRREPAAGYALWVVISAAVFHLFVVGQEARYMAGPATLLAVFSAVWLARRIEGWSAGRVYGPAAGARRPGLGGTIPPTQS